MTRILLFFSLVSALLLASCQPAPQTVDDRPLTVTPTVNGGPANVTPTPSPTPEPTEAPVTLAELGIPAGQENFFSGVEGHINREVIDGEKVYTTTILYHNGEQKEVKYIVEPGTFDAHTEIHDNLTRPLAVKAYRLDENGKKTDVTLLWQGPERGFREAIDLSGAYDPELNQVDKHPYVHIVHGDRPIQSIDDLPLEDERLTLLQSIRLEQAKAIRALQVIREKLKNGESITPEDLQDSIFLRRLQEKLQAGETITEDDFYVFFSSKAVEKRDPQDPNKRLSLLFFYDKDGSKRVVVKSRADDQPNQTYDSLNEKLLPLWFSILGQDGNYYDVAIFSILDIDDIKRYNENNQDPLFLQGKLGFTINILVPQLKPENLTILDLRQAYRQNRPLSPKLFVYAEGPFVDRYPVTRLLSLPDNQAKDFEFWSSDINYQLQRLNENKKLIEILLVTSDFPYQCPPELQFYLLPSEMATTQ